jgi:hypothetical protein
MFKKEQIKQDGRGKVCGLPGELGRITKKNSTQQRSRENGAKKEVVWTTAPG